MVHRACDCYGSGSLGTVQEGSDDCIGLRTVRRDLHPYRRYATQSWFAGDIQKMVSISAATASVKMTLESPKVFDGQIKPAVFDSRVFVVPYRGAQLLCVASTGRCAQQCSDVGTIIVLS
jgi:hypothetical protein